MIATRVILTATLLTFGQCVEMGPYPSDAGPCGGAYCNSDRPHCDPQTNTCVVCLGDEHCAAPTATCHLGTHTCVACMGPASCVEEAQPVCETSTGGCRGCTNDGECAGRPATPECDEASGRCVQCSAATEVERCGGHSCDRETGLCTETTLGSVAWCGPCQADSECQASTACVTRSFEGNVIGSYCLPIRPDMGCGATMTNTGLLPFSTSIETATVDGTPVNVCSLRESISCEGFRKWETECVLPVSGSQLDACGNIAMHDGHCFVAGSQTPSCAYACVSDSDCRDTYSCESISGGTAWVCQ